MKAENKDTFSTSKAIKQIISDLRLTKQKTTKITPFEAHFGRPANTPLRNISTTPSNLYLTYEKIINHYLDADTNPADDFLDDAGWVNPERSDSEIEKTMCRAQQDTGRRYRDSDNKESRFIIHPKLTDPIQQIYGQQKGQQIYGRMRNGVLHHTNRLRKRRSQNIATI